jgi:hypothetical protein
LRVKDIAAPIISIDPFSAWSATAGVARRLVIAGWVERPLRIAVCVNMTRFLC